MVIKIFAILISVILMMGVGCKKGKIEAGNYNLLVITLDTMRADRVGAYGYRTAQTPNLDALAQKGVLFEQCYTSVPLTLPSHCSIFTGQYPLAHQVRDNGTYMLNPGAETLAEILKKKGYQTFAAIGAYVLLGRFGLDQGFDVYDDTLNVHKMYNDFQSEIPAPAVYEKFRQWYENNYHRKFFAWVHFYDPHVPYAPPEKYREKFSDDPEGHYNGEVAFVDEYVGKILETLKAKNALDKTLVVAVGDHGEAFGEHQEQGHGIFCYEETLKVPLIFGNPGLFPKPLRVKTRVNLVDLMPTLLEIMGVEVPGSSQGKSLEPLLAGQSAEPPRQVYFESMHGRDDRNWAPLMGLIDGTYKYISLPEPELYNLETDPQEKDNLFLKQNRLAKEMDRELMKTAMENSTPNVETRRGLTGEDKKHLQTLGYISSFSGQTQPGMDPKKGILLDNEIKRIFKIIDNGNPGEVEKALNGLTAQNPGDTIGIFDLKHHLYSGKKDIDKSLEILEAAMAKYPKIERFYSFYAAEAMGVGQMEKAEAAAGKLVELNPNYAPGFIILGEIAEKRGNIDIAVKYFKEALGIEPQNLPLKLKLAEFLILKKEIRGALAIYDEILERHEGAMDAGLMFKIALFNAQYGTLEKSEQLLKKTIELEPNGKYYYNYALVLAKDEKLPGALENMKIALEKYRGDLTGQQAQMAERAVELWTAAISRGN